VLDAWHHCTTSSTGSALPPPISACLPPPKAPASQARASAVSRSSAQHSAVTHRSTPQAGPSRRPGLVGRRPRPLHRRRCRRAPAERWRCRRARPAQQRGFQDAMRAGLVLISVGRCHPSLSNQPHHEGKGAKANMLLHCQATGRAGEHIPQCSGLPTSGLAA